MAPMRRSDLGGKIRIQSQYRNASVDYNGIPIRFMVISWPVEGVGEPFIRLRNSSEIAGLKIEGSETRIVFVGYNLFEEIDFRFSVGQPKENSLIPTSISIYYFTRFNYRCGVSTDWNSIVPAVMILLLVYHDIDFAGMRNQTWSAQCSVSCTGQPLDRWFRGLTENCR